MQGESKTPEMDESRRKILREVELKVMKYADKLEANGLSRSEKTVQDELEKYRQHLIEVTTLSAFYLSDTSCLYVY